MKFQSGNNFWELRSTHGRNTLFATPELMWEAACEYFQWCADNPLRESIYNAKDDKIVEVPKLRALTMVGLCLYLDCSKPYFGEFKKTCSVDFSDIINRIEQIIYKQKFEAASAGLLKENIISRELGLVDKTEGEVKTQSTVINYTTELTKEEIQQIAKDLENDI